jgi:hypothetical protein
MRYTSGVTIKIGPGVVNEKDTSKRIYLAYRPLCGTKGPARSVTGRSEDSGRNERGCTSG